MRITAAAVTDNIYRAQKAGDAPQTPILIDLSEGCGGCAPVGIKDWAPIGK